MSTPGKSIPPPPIVNNKSQEKDWLIFNSFMVTLCDKIKELEHRIEDLEK